MTALCIIQARMGSSRLPGKVLEPIGPYPAIKHVYVRAQLAISDTVVATTSLPKDDALAAYLASEGIPVFRWGGAEADVLGRYAACARAYPGDPIVRVTGDCPFLDPVLVAEAVHKAKGRRRVYVSNVRTRTYPRGLDVEAFSRCLLEEADAIAVGAHDREHVTPMVRGLAECQIGLLSGTDYSKFRWTLDTADDLAWFRAIAAQTDCTPPDPTPRALLDLCARIPCLRRYDAPPVHR